MSAKVMSKALKELPKASTGIEGFDEITKGGLPRGRPTLIVGGPGSGKTLFGMEFLVNGATKFNEPGVFFSFEETENELVRKRRLPRFRRQGAGKEEDAIDRLRQGRSGGDRRDRRVRSRRSRSSASVTPSIP